MRIGAGPVRTTTTTTTILGTATDQPGGVVLWYTTPMYTGPTATVGPTHGGGPTAGRIRTVRAASIPMRGMVREALGGDGTSRISTAVGAIRTVGAAVPTDGVHRTVDGELPTEVGVLPTGGGVLLMDSTILGVARMDTTIHGDGTTLGDGDPHTDGTVTTAPIMDTPDSTVDLPTTAVMQAETQEATRAVAVPPTEEVLPLNPIAPLPDWLLETMPRCALL